MDDTTLETKVAAAIREEITRQYRDDDRGKCPAGTHFWEEHVQPMLLAQVALRTVGEQLTTGQEAKS